MSSFQTLVLVAFLFPISACTTTPLTTSSDAHQAIRHPEPDDHGRYLSCGWICGAPPIRVSASSTLEEGGYPYSAENLLDAKKETVWVEGVKGSGGIGERITFTFDMTDRKPSVKDLGISRVSIINGFARSEELWNSNSRVKTLKVFFDGEYLETVSLEDRRDHQWIDLPKMTFVPGKMHEVVFEIAEVYPGTRFLDTTLADFLFDGFGVTH